MGEEMGNKTEMNIIVVRDLYGQHAHDSLQSMQERITGQGSIFY